MGDVGSDNGREAVFSGAVDGEDERSPTPVATVVSWDGNSGAKERREEHLCGRRKHTGEERVASGECNSISTSQVKAVRGGRVNSLFCILR